MLVIDGFTAKRYLKVDSSIQLSSVQKYGACKKVTPDSLPSTNHTTILHHWTDDSVRFALG